MWMRIKPADAGRLGDLQHRSNATVTVFHGQIGAAIGIKTFVDQEIHAADFIHVSGIPGGGGVGYVGHAMAGPIEPETKRSARMCQREVRQLPAFGQQRLFSQGFYVERRPNGQIVEKKMFFHCI